MLLQLGTLVPHTCAMCLSVWVCVCVFRVQKVMSACDHAQAFVFLPPNTNRSPISRTHKHTATYTAVHTNGPECHITHLYTYTHFKYSRAERACSSFICTHSQTCMHSARKFCGTHTHSEHAQHLHTYTHTHTHVSHPSSFLFIPLHVRTPPHCSILRSLTTLVQRPFVVLMTLPPSLSNIPSTYTHPLSTLKAPASTSARTTRATVCNGTAPSPASRNRCHAPRRPLDLYFARAVGQFPAVVLAVVVVAAVVAAVAAAAVAAAVAAVVATL